MRLGSPQTSQKLGRRLSEVLCLGEAVLSSVITGQQKGVQAVRQAIMRDLELGALSSELMSLPSATSLALHHYVVLGLPPASSLSYASFKLLS